VDNFAAFLFIMLSKLGALARITPKHQHQP